MSRGHLASDASFDHSQRSLHAVYVMSNIIPQEAQINSSKNAWAGVEILGRKLAHKYGKINVLNGIEYSEKPKRIGHNQIAVPKGFWKMYYSDDMKYQRCFYFINEPITDEKKRIKDYEVGCSSLLK